MGRKYGSSEKDSGILFKGEKKNKTTRLFGKCINCAVAFAFFKVSSLQVQLGPLGLGMDPYSCRTSGDTLEMRMCLVVGDYLCLPWRLNTQAIGTPVSCIFLF